MISPVGTGSRLLFPLDDTVLCYQVEVTKGSRFDDMGAGELTESRKDHALLVFGKAA